MTRSDLNTIKWEANIERLKDPSLLCFGTAEMDFSTAPVVLDTITQIASRGHFGYPHKRQSYFDTIISFYDQKYGWKLEAEWIDSHVGIYTSMNLLIEELTEPGDEIIYQTPVHHTEELIQRSQRVAVANPLCSRNGHYTMDMDGLAALVNNRTKMLLLCSPHNPIGRVWTRRELECLSRFCVEKGIILITDEVYFGLIKKGKNFVPMAAISEEASMNTITLTSVSKSFNLAGLKHSLVIAKNPEYRAAFRRGIVRSNSSFGGCIFGHAATEAALKDGDLWRASLMEYVHENFLHLQKYLQDSLPQVKIVQPEGTYFAWLDLRNLGVPEDRLKRVVENDARITVTFGEHMGPGGEGHIRINLATAKSTLNEGLKRLIQALLRHVEKS